MRVSIANLNSLNSRRPEITKLMELMVRAIDWSYRDDRSLDTYAEFAGVSREVARRTRDEFYPRSAFDFEAVHGSNRCSRTPSNTSTSRH